MTNKDIYDFTLEHGHIPKHATNVIRRMKSDGKLDYFGHTKINYVKCYREGDIISFKVKANEKDKN